MRVAQHRTAEERAALAVLKAADKRREKEAAQVKRVHRAYNGLLRAMGLTLSELPEVPQDRVLEVLTAIVSDPKKLAVCEKALAPRGWAAVETSVVEEEPVAREAAD